MGKARKSYPRFRRVEEEALPRIELTQDDIDILRTVHRHRFVRAGDLYRLFPERSPDRLSRRLTLLYRNRFLDRPTAQIDRFRQGGSQSLVYGLDRAGARFLKEYLGVHIGETDWKSRNRTYTRENLDHTLATTSFLIGVELACRSNERLAFVPFDEILTRAPEKTRTAAMPGRWPVPIRHYGSRAEVYLAPDAMFGLRLARGTGAPLTSYYFTEIDRGTMTIAPARRVRESEAFLHRATVLRKLLTYAQSWHSNLHREHFNIPNVRVLTVTTTVKRMQAISNAARDLVVAPLRVPPQLFLFSASADCFAKAMLDPVLEN